MRESTMRKILIGVLAFVFTGAMIVEEAEARRFGGARSLGVQRNVTPPPARPAPQQQAAPAGQQAAPAGQQAQQAAPGAQAGAQGAAASGSRWAPMLGGLALGGLLGYLFAGNGLGGLLLLGLLAFGAVMLFRAMARHAPASGQAQYAGGMRAGGMHAGGMRAPVAVPGDREMHERDVPYGAAPAVPADFDTAGFLRAAKMNFAKLQLANDAGDLDEIREFTTPELFEALKPEILARAGEPQQTDVMGLEAELLEVATEGSSYRASIRFSGEAREAAGEAPQPFAEVWHLAKPVDGSSGWLLAGIQQPH